VGACRRTVKSFGLDYRMSEMPGTKNRWESKRSVGGNGSGSRSPNARILTNGLQLVGGGRGTRRMRQHRRRLFHKGIGQIVKTCCHASR